jgi:hypothetical protein
MFSAAALSAVPAHGRSSNNGREMVSSDLSDQVAEHRSVDLGPRQSWVHTAV